MRCSRLMLLILALGVLGWVGCESVVLSELDCPIPDTAVEDLVLDTAMPDVAVEDGVFMPIPPGAVGSACVADDECNEGSCFTKESLNELYKTFDPDGSWEYEIPGGMCSNILCANDSQCGDGGFCFNVGPLFDAGMDIGLCLRACEDYSDCRYPEGYICYFTGIEGERACLPDELVLEIPCGNGKCDTDLNESAETCPRDCE